MPAGPPLCARRCAGRSARAERCERQQAASLRMRTENQGRKRRRPQEEREQPTKAERNLFSMIAQRPLEAWRIDMPILGGRERDVLVRGGKIAGYGGALWVMRAGADGRLALCGRPLRQAVKRQFDARCSPDRGRRSRPCQGRNGEEN